MRISTPVTVSIINHFKNASDPITHFQCDGNGNVECFSEMECEEKGCEVKMQGANVLVFVHAATTGRVGIFKEAGLKPSTAGQDYCMDDDGHIFCPACYAKRVDTAQA